MKIQSFFAIFIGSFVLLCFLVVIILFYNNQSSDVDSLALEFMTLLSEWNQIENTSNDILLKRFSHFGRESSPFIEAWEKQYNDFEKKMDKVMDNPIIKHQPELASRLDGAYRVWRFAEVRLNNASHFFKQIIQTGLGEKVIVNGMLHTMYQMRMDGQLDVDEICLLEETIYAFENLDNASDEFNYLFSSIVHDMKTEGEKYLRRIRLLLVALFSSAVFVLIVSMLIYRQLKAAQQNRTLYLESRRARLLRGLCENSSEEELSLFRKKRNEYGINLSIDSPVLIIKMQIDDFENFSHKFNIEEQQEHIYTLCEDFKTTIKKESYNSEWFRYDDEFIVYMVNVDDDPEILHKIIPSWQKDAENRYPFSVSVTMSDICFENQDLDQDFEYIQQLSEYRYLMGRNAFIIPGAWQHPPDEEFRYPLEKERQFEEAFKSLDKNATLNLMAEMFEYAEPYGPEAVKRLVLRLTAAQSSVVEILEKSYHIFVSKGLTPMIITIQKTETLDEAKKMLIGLIENVINNCIRMKSEKHDQTVIMIKEIIEEELSDFNLSADQIADKFNLTTSYINRLFKQHTSLSIAGYINDCRLRKAEGLLRTTEQTVAQIAEQSGFSSMGTFFRLFKKKYGQTPGERASLQLKSLY